MDVGTYATVEDLELRFRPLNLSEREKAAALLDDAAVIIRSEMASADVAIDPENEDQISSIRSVSCSMVKRAMSVNTGEAINQSSVTVGPFSRQVTYANPTSEMYLTKQDKRLLGIIQDGGGFAFIRPVITRGGQDA